MIVIDPLTLNSFLAAATLLFTALLTTVQLFNGWFARRSAAEAAKATAEAVKATVVVAQKVDQVKEVAAVAVQAATNQGNQILSVNDKIHTLVNSQMGQQLMLYAVTARTLANLTNKPEHLKAADEADKKLEEHQLRQSVVDHKEGLESDALPGLR